MRSAGARGGSLGRAFPRRGAGHHIGEVRAPSADRAPFVRLLLAVLLLGIAESMALPYLVLFGKERLGLPPLAIGVFVSVVGASGMVASVWLGRWYDCAPGRASALVAFLAGSMGYALLDRTGSYLALLALGATFLGPAAAAFPQLFALARSRLGSGAAATHGIAVLRSGWSLAWAVGPPLGSAVLARGGYGALFAATAAGYVAVGLAVAARAPSDRQRASPAPVGGPRPSPASPAGPVAATLAFALFHTAMFSGSVVLPLFVTETLSLPYGAVGMLFSACALVEIPAALALVLVPRGARLEPLLLLGMALFVAYFAAAALSQRLLALALAQIARGSAIAVVGALGITYFQDLMPDEAGRATALFANTATAGSLLSGVLAGATAQLLGYRATFVLCGLLSAVGGVLIVQQRRALGRAARPSSPPFRPGTNSRA